MIYRIEIDRKIANDVKNWCANSLGNEEYVFDLALHQYVLYIKEEHIMALKIAFGESFHNRTEFKNIYKVGA